MKILCVVTGEALIDGRGMDGVSAGREWKAVQDMMVEVLPALATKSFSGSLISIKQVYLAVGDSLSAFIHTKPFWCVWQTYSPPFVVFPLNVCQEMKEKSLQRLDR